jgi:uncharacterized YccA/Bax inhibitor family protein
MMANPALSEKTLEKVMRSQIADDVGVMTIHGTINKAGLLVVLTVVGAMVGWSVVSIPLLIAALIGSLVLSLLIIFGPQRAPMLAPAYAFAEGVLLGSISLMFSQVYPGIITNALILTVSCLALMLALYRFQIVRASETLRSVLTIAVSAIALTYLTDIVLSFFGTRVPMIHENSPLGIGFSVVVTGVAAFSLIMDFDMIERASNQRAPKYMEWYGGFALLVTLVWLYMEVLRLLSKLNKK